jgi:hypothetical protein
MFGIPTSFVIAIILIILIVVRVAQRSGTARKPGKSIPPQVQPVPPASVQPSKPAAYSCIHCGAPNLPDARVCVHCGLKMPDKMA